MLWSKLTFAIFFELVLSYLLGRAAIPLLRRLKTGKYEPYIGDRFSADGSEPAFGGAVMLAVLIFGISIAATFGEAKRLFLAAIYVFAVTLPGVLDDWLTEVRKRSYLVKSGAKFGWCYAASLVFLLIYTRQGYSNTAILLPFRLGIIDLKAAFCPVMAAVMSLAISAHRLANRFGADEKSCVDGLCQTLAFFEFSAAAVIGTAINDDGLTAFGYTAAAAAAGGLIWGLSPAKLRSGSSGGYFCGGLSAALICFSPYLAAAMLLLCLPAIADAVCSAVQYAVYRLSGKFMLKGSSLHSHLAAKGMNDYKIIAVFAAISLISAAAAVFYAYYSTKIII